MSNIPGHTKERSYELPSNDLTPREREIVTMLASGLKSRHIALRLGISPKTADNYARSAMGKLGLYNRRQLVERFKGPCCACKGT